MKQGEVL
jgi:hypothetical protein